MIFLPFLPMWHVGETTNKQKQQTHQTQNSSWGLCQEQSSRRADICLTGSQSGRGGYGCGRHQTRDFYRHTSARKPQSDGGVGALWPLTLKALACTIWQSRGNFQLVSWRYVVDFYEVRSASRTRTKLGPVVAICHWRGHRINNKENIVLIGRLVTPP